MDKSQLKIVFLGTPEFAVTSLDRIISEGYNVVGVVTMPDKPAGRGHKLLHSPVKKYALEHNLNLMQPVNLKDDVFVSQLRALNADLFIVIAFRMLPQVVWAMPPLGTFNLHASLLPKYRGAAPINRAVMNGDTETGVTTFMLKHEIDTGDILRQEKIEIAPDENVGSVHDRLMVLGADLVIDTLQHITAGTLSPIPQDQLIGGEEPTPAPKIFAKDMAVDWSKSAVDVHNQIRGLSPYPAARAEMLVGDEPGGIFKLLESRLTDNSTNNPVGSVRTTKDGKQMYVVCGDGRELEITQLQPPGKRPMAMADYLRGAHLGDTVTFVLPEN